jgi:hypothetical protein
VRPAVRIMDLRIMGTFPIYELRADSATFTRETAHVCRAKKHMEQKIGRSPFRWLVKWGQAREMGTFLISYRATAGMGVVRLV